MKNRRGIILIFVLVILLTFSLLALGLGFRARIANRLSYYLMSEYEDVYVVKRTLNEVMFKMAEDNNAYDSLGEEWAKDMSFELEDETRVKVFVSDEDGKLNINEASEEWLFNLISLSLPLKDRIIKERPFLVVEEVFYLENMGERFYPKKATISSLVTTHNHDKMNVNTAREEILFSMPGLSEITAETVLSLRENEPIENLEVLKDLAGITVSEYQNLNKFFKTTSDFYIINIQIENKKEKIERSFKVALRKSLKENTLEIIRWLEE